MDLQCGVHWPDDYIGPDLMTHWIIEKSVGFTDVGLYKISESIRTYGYLILSSQASARSSIVGNLASSLTAQSAFLNNFENVVNRKVDISEDIKHYQNTLSYASINSKHEHPPPRQPPGFCTYFQPRSQGFVPSELPGGCPGVGPIIKVPSCQLMPDEGTFQLQTDLPSAATL